MRTPPTPSWQDVLDLVTQLDDGRDSATVRCAVNERGGPRHHTRSGTRRY